MVEVEPFYNTGLLKVCIKTGYVGHVKYIVGMRTVSGRTHRGR